MTVDIAALITVIENTLKNVRNEQWEYRKINGEHQVIVKGSLKTGAGWQQYSHITNEVDDIRKAKYIAAVNPENINTLITELEEAQARIAELEREQGPVATMHRLVNKLNGRIGGWECSMGILDAMDGESVNVEVKPLYTTPPKAVAVLHKVKHWREAPCNGVYWAKGWKEGWNACVKEVEAAGIVVKDGD